VRLVGQKRRLAEIIPPVKVDQGLFFLSPDFLKHPESPGHNDVKGVRRLAFLINNVSPLAFHVPDFLFDQTNFCGGEGGEQGDFAEGVTLANF